MDRKTETELIKFLMFKPHWTYIIILELDIINSQIKEFVKAKNLSLV